jgi:hypothetical protein
MAGNADTLGTEVLESLLKMAPTKEEERKLKEYRDDSAIKLGPAEKFLKALLDVPFAFRRVDAMLYIANFESEVEYLKKAFEYLEVSQLNSLPFSPLYTPPTGSLSLIPNEKSESFSTFFCKIFYSCTTIEVIHQFGPLLT